MSGQKKIALTAFAILLVPCLFYILLTRGKNEFVHLPVYGNFRLSNSLTDQQNNIISGKNTDEKFLVASFYTINGDTLNQLLNGHLKKIQNKFNEPDDVRIISFILPPDSSMPSLQAISEKEGALYGKWYFTGLNNGNNLKKIESDLGLKEAPDPKQCYKTIYLIDKQNNIRGIHNGTDSYSVDTLMDEVKLLRWEEWEKTKK